MQGVRLLTLKKIIPFASALAIVVIFILSEQFQKVVIDGALRKNIVSVSYLEHNNAAEDRNDAMNHFSLSKSYTSTTSLQQHLRRVQEENRKVSQSGEKVFSHFLSHIPKTGSSYAFHRLDALSWANPEWQKHNTTNTIRVCNQATKSTEIFEESYSYEYKGDRCALWMSESPYTTKAKHVYTIVRNPRTHVISQYFHCKESRPHRNRAHFMPERLDEWLDAHVSHIQNATHVPNFRCYNPINMQSTYAAFDKNTTKAALKQRYNVIGVHSQMDKTVCIIFLWFTGYFPPQCNCSMDQNNRRLARKHDHGVSHHGDTFNTTASQKAAIDILTQTDALLYKMATELFEEQIQEVEEELGVVLCEKIKL